MEGKCLVFSFDHHYNNSKDSDILNASIKSNTLGESEMVQYREMEYTHDTQNGKESLILLEDVEKNENGFTNNLPKVFSFMTSTLVHKSERPFQCHQCHNAYTRKSHLTRHLRIHSGEKPHQCNHCHKCFTKKANLTKHLRIHSGENPFHCYQCDKSFTQRGSLTKHLRIHSGEWPFQCNQCLKPFNQKGDLTRHLRIHYGELPFLCSVCGMGFIQKSTMQNHQTKKHKENMAFNNPLNADSHTISEKWACSAFASMFCTLDKEQKMDQLVKNDGKHHCSECTFSTKYRRSLKDHLRVHLSERPFQCQQCHKNFTMKRYLTKHLLNHERPFKCKVCPKSFAYKAELTAHLRIHTGERPFRCHQCSQTYSRKSHLMRHLPIHSGERPFQCNVCPKSFNYKSNLTNHLRIHTGELPFLCSHCGMGFNRKHSKDNHERTHEKTRSIQDSYFASTNIRDLSKIEVHNEGFCSTTGPNGGFFICNTCGGRFNTWGSMQIHESEVHSCTNTFQVPPLQDNLHSSMQFTEFFV